MSDTIAQRNIAYVNAMTAAALIKMQGMVAANVNAQIAAQGQNRNASLPFLQKDFDQLIEDYGIHHNAVLSSLNHGLNY